MTRGQKIPDEKHPITVTPTEGTVRVTIGDTVVAESTRSLTLQEADYPPVQYVPLADVDASLLSETATSTHCPYKGDASYYTVTTADGAVEDAGWTYHQAYDAVAEITDHVAWYPDKASVEIG
ncbi:DUF427 domain-containing protein [Nocardioides mangrovicus]|uniref:DUF427 domain-containing protein n=1 Tax=Nocardioides mangrovicus TaxID=2478913 RepID=A0A3L8NWH8_9ACTN|nr:DUF427 domain-containing protein [Nocardioides mangrovicus]RLV47505.1 DUF427 domain-containing protein [Nocardioides mangrovicus]